MNTDGKIYYDGLTKYPKVDLGKKRDKESFRPRLRVPTLFELWLSSESYKNLGCGLSADWQKDYPLLNLEVCSDGSFTFNNNTGYKIRGEDPKTAKRKIDIKKEMNAIYLDGFFTFPHLKNLFEHKNGFLFENMNLKKIRTGLSSSFYGLRNNKSGTIKTTALYGLKRLNNIFIQNGEKSIKRIAVVLCYNFSNDAPYYTTYDDFHILSRVIEYDKFTYGWTPKQQLKLVKNINTNTHIAYFIEFKDNTNTGWMLFDHFNRPGSNCHISDAVNWILNPVLMEHPSKFIFWARKEWINAKKYKDKMNSK